MESKELREKAKALSQEIDELSLIPEDELTQEQIVRFEECLTEAKTLAVNIRKAEAEERQKALETIRTHAETPGHVEVGSVTEQVRQVPSKKRNPYDFSNLETRFSVSAYNPENPRAIPTSVASELRSRAHDAIEQAPEYVSDDTREVIARHVDRDADGHVAAHCLNYGSPEYLEAFSHYMRTGEKRAALSTTNANGGYLIPFYLDPTIILTNTGGINPFREIADVVTITSTVWHGVSSAGVTAEWTAEATEFADASPTFSQPTITTHKADAYVQASFEVTEDSNIGSQIAMLFGDAKNRLEATAFATGVGDASNQPWGIVTRIQTASAVNAQTNASFGLIDVFNLVGQLPARYQPNCSWAAHWSIFNLVRQFATGSNTASAFWVDLGPATPSTLVGRPTYNSSAMKAAPLSTATASSDNILILGDFRQGYKIVDRIGMEVVYNPLVLGASGRRPTGEVGWACFWRTGADTVNNDAFRLLVV